MALTIFALVCAVRFSWRPKWILQRAAFRGQVEAQNVEASKASLDEFVGFEWHEYHAKPEKLSWIDRCLLTFYGEPRVDRIDLKYFVNDPDNWPGNFDDETAARLFPEAHVTYAVFYRTLPTPVPNP